jgi:hypothetical protein
VIALGGAATTSVCGHRWLAQHHGWNMGTVLSLITDRPTQQCSRKSTN